MLVQVKYVYLGFVHINGKTNCKRLDLKKGHGFKSLVPAFSVIAMMEKRTKRHFLHETFTFTQNYTFCDQVSDLFDSVGVNQEEFVLRQTIKWLVSGKPGVCRRTWLSLRKKKSMFLFCSWFFSSSKILHHPRGVKSECERLCWLQLLLLHRLSVWRMGRGSWAWETWAAMGWASQWASWHCTQPAGGCRLSSASPSCWTWEQITR